MLILWILFAWLNSLLNTHHLQSHSGFERCGALQMIGGNTCLCWQLSGTKTTPVALLVSTVTFFILFDI